jgi:hypothetical protein
MWFSWGPACCVARAFSARKTDARVNRETPADLPSSRRLRPTRRHLRHNLRYVEEPVQEAEAASGSDAAQRRARDDGGRVRGKEYLGASSGAMIVSHPPQPASEPATGWRPPPPPWSEAYTGDEPEPLERVAPEPRRARPDTDVRRLRRLRLHPDEALDHRRWRESRAVEEELPRECRAVQFSQREDSFGHRSRHSNPPTERRIRSRGSFVVPGDIAANSFRDIRERWRSRAPSHLSRTWFSKY